MISARGHFRLCTVLALLLSGVLALHAEPPLPPKPGRYFNDYANVVAPDVAQRLNAKLDQFERDTSNQVLVAIFPKLPEGTYLEDYTIKTFQSWGPGGKRQDNGLVLFVFVEDRKMRIEVGYGLEGVLPDSIAASIIREQIRPQFKLGNYAAGVEQGVDAIIKATRNEYKGNGSTLDDKADDSPISGTKVLVILGIVALFFIWSSMGDTMIQRGGRFVFWNLLDIARILFISLLSGGNSGGGSGGRSSGGGFSGGGGSGGGGGASGSW